MDVLTTRPQTLEQINVVYLYVLKERKVQNFLQISSKMELKHLCHEVIRLLYFLNQKSRLFQLLWRKKCTQNLTTVVMLLCSTRETTCASARVEVAKCWMS